MNLRGGYVTRRTNVNEFETDETTSVQHISQNYSSLFNLSKVTNENMASNNVSKSLNGKSHHFYEIFYKNYFINHD